jgi:photosystem II stability/assembly factor-like uncharacterized protein
MYTIPGRHHILLCVLVALVAHISLYQQLQAQGADTWQSIGPHGQVGTISVLDDGTLIAQSGYFIARSSDQGKTWEYSRPPGLGTGAKMNATDGRNMVVVFSGKAFYRSFDAGMTWTPVAQDVNLMDVGCPSPGTFVAIRQEPIASKFYRSSDSGATWQLVPGFENMYITSLACDARQSLVVVANTASLYVSTDAGSTWTQHVLPAQFYNSAPTRIHIARNGDFFVNIWDGIHRFSYKTGTWKKITDFYSVATVTRAMVTTPSGDLFLVRENGHVMIGDPDTDTTFTTIPTGAYENVYTLAAGPDGSIYRGGERGLFRSVGGYDTWTQIAPATGYNRGMAVTNTGHLVVPLTMQPVWFAVSSDNGVTWEDRQPVQISGSVNVNAEFVTTPQGTIVLNIKSYGGLYRSTNEGLLWDQCFVDPENHPLWGKLVAITATREGIIYGFCEAFTYGSWTLFRSDDQANSWRPVATVPVNSAAIAADSYGNIVVSSKYEVNVYTGDTVVKRMQTGFDDSTSKGFRGIVIDDYGHIYLSSTRTMRSNDDGMFEPIDAIEGSSSAIMVHGDEVYIGTNKGKNYRSTDRGITWKELQELPGAISQFVRDSSGGILAATLARSVFRLQGPADVPQQSFASDSFGDVHVVPNPSHEAVTFRVSTQRSAASIRVRVTNTIGTVVAIIDASANGSGTHDIRWDHKRLPAGLYLYSVEIGGEIRGGTVALTE